MLLNNFITVKYISLNYIRLHTFKYYLINDKFENWENLIELIKSRKIINTNKLTTIIYWRWMWSGNWGGGVNSLNFLISFDGLVLTWLGCCSKFLNKFKRSLAIPDAFLIISVLFKFIFTWDMRIFFITNILYLFWLI